MNLLRRFAAPALTVALILGGCYCAHFWLFHGWAASTGPAGAAADAWRAGHYAWSVRFLVAACACFIAAGVWGSRGLWRRLLRRTGSKRY